MAPSEPSVDLPGGQPSVGGATRDEPVSDPTADSTAALDRRSIAEHVAVLGSLVLLEWPVTQAEGGRGTGVAALLALVTAVAVLATRPWTVLPRRWLLLAPVVALAALAVLPLTGVGRGGAVAALGYVVSAGLLVAVAAYARSAVRRAAVAAVLCAGGIAQFGWALVPWWGGGDPSRPMVGTYFWHNQFAVALLLPALLGLSVVLAGVRPWRAAGWLAAPLATAGIVLSTSRATLACLLVGWVVVVAVALVAAPDRRQAAVRAGAVSLLAVAVTFVLPGPPLFATSASPLSGAATRSAAGETVSANTTYRTEFWRESLSVLAAHPIAGAGYGRLATEAQTLVPTSWARSPLAHSGPLQALADGGLLLGLPVLAALGLIVVALLRRLVGYLRLRRPVADAPEDHLAARDRVLVAGAAVTALVLVGHSLVDTDWSYAALAASFAVVVGLALAALVPRVTSQPPGPAGAAGGRLAIAATAVLVLALFAGATAAWGQQFHIIGSNGKSTGEARS